MALSNINLNDNNNKIKHYKIQKKIGKGAYGTVYLCDKINKNY